MGAVAAAVIVRKERELVDHFRGVGAVSPDTARSLAQLAVDQNIGWRRLVDHAVLRSTPAGTWYLDEPSWMALRRMRRRLMTVVAVVAALFLLGSIIAVSIGTHS
ncbi:MAG TPA: hypothetical protein VFI39_07145 [Gemmatimonadales bacterium]|nr:hypothetical protein [Gemmatimonadales bacterium]